MSFEVKSYPVAYPYDFIGKWDKFGKLRPASLVGRKFSKIPHSGMDLRNLKHRDRRVFAIADGVVTHDIDDLLDDRMRNSSGYVGINHGEITALYVHVDNNVKRGQRVKAGDHIGWYTAQARHLHITFIQNATRSRIDPYNYLIKKRDKIMLAKLKEAAIDRLFVPFSDKRNFPHSEPFIGRPDKHIKDIKSADTPEEVVEVIRRGFSKGKNLEERFSKYSVALAQATDKLKNNPCDDKIVKEYEAKLVQANELLEELQTLINI